jgi:uncharacterized RDD family membrane protein YckC
VEYEDRITITAPEGIDLEYTLAGLGSRFIASFLDLLVRVIVLAAVLGLMAALGASSTALGIVLIVGLFLALFGYDIAFEVWGSGRTPGKRWSGLRVLMVKGQPVSFAPSAVRNIMRIIDIWATALIAGTVSILATRRNQLLGDLAAGTIVVRERGDLILPIFGAAPTADVSSAAPSGIDVTAVSASELAAIVEFLGRRERLTGEARARVARTLADGLGTKVGGIVPGTLSPEDLLQAIVAAKSGAHTRYGSAPTSDGG